MNKLKSLFLLGFSIGFACNLYASPIESYFNYNQNNKYQDTYRHIYRSGDDLEAKVLLGLKSAKFSIDIAIQELRLPSISKLLVEKMKQGVQVRVILENSYNNTLTELTDYIDNNQSEHNNSRYRELFKFIDLNNNGVISQTEIFERDAVFILRNNKVPLIDDTADDSFGSGLMHHKFIVIDDKTTLISTANFTMSGIHGDFTNNKSRGNPNSLIRVESASFAKLFKNEFNIMWGDSGLPRFGQNKPYRKAKKVKVGRNYITVQFSPTSKRYSYEESVNGLITKNIKKSKKQVLMSLFVFSEQEIANALKAKYEKSNNFKLGLLIERKFAYRDYSELLDVWGLEVLNDECRAEFGNLPWTKPFVNAGVPNLNPADVLHHKFAVLDSSTTIVGSHNWSASANRSNDENLIVIQSKSIAEEYADEFYRLENNSTMGPPSSLLTRVKDSEENCSK